MLCANLNSVLYAANSVVVRVAMVHASTEFQPGSRPLCFNVNESHGMNSYSIGHYPCCMFMS